MNGRRNPFRLRAAEHIEYEATFLRLFGPGMLDLLPIEQLWNKPLFFRSAPGGGKTSLLRLFTPSSLLALHAHRAVPEYQDLFARMQALGVIDDLGPSLLGVMLSCARNYATLSGLEVEPSRQKRLLLGLLNARIALATLRGALALKQLAFPEDLGRLQLTALAGLDLPPGIHPGNDGKLLYDWAATLEGAVCDAIDSFGPSQLMRLTGHDVLHGLAFLQPNAIAVDGHPLAQRSLLMLDDIHKLTHGQREHLIQTVLDQRTGVGIWLAERLEVLSSGELLSSGATEGRDYDGIVYLERFWRDRYHHRRFEKTVSDIGDRRAQIASDVHLESFAGSLPGSLDGVEYQQRMEKVRDTVVGRLRARIDREPVYKRFIDSLAESACDQTPLQTAMAWQAREIIIERESRRVQKRFDFAVEPDEAEHQTDHAVKAAAELFLARDFGLPYYFGPTRLSAIASSNIEQFLWLASDLFEEVIAAGLMRRATQLAPERQEAILKHAIRERWDQIPKGVRHGREVRGFIEAIGQFARWVTDQPNAPYAPGVTGIAISMADLEKLRDPLHLDANPDHARLAALIAPAIAHNLLEPQTEKKSKGESWCVLYLNRMLCVYFGLPLTYSGYRPRTLRDLVQWVDRGFVVPAKGSEALL